MSGTGRPGRVTDEEIAAVQMVLSDSWTSQPVLAMAARMTVRRLQAVVHVLRLEGAPVLSGPRGNRETASPAELRDDAESLHHRAMEILAVAGALRATANRLEARYYSRPTQTALPLDGPPATA